MRRKPTSGTGSRPRSSPGGGAGANTKVIEVVLHIRSSGISPEQLAVELPHLSPAQIHSAMAYFWDHREALDADIERRREYVERLRREMGQPPIVGELLKRRRA